MALISIQGLGVRASGLPLLRDVSLEVDADRPLAIIGPSGAGKTTLLRALLGLVIPAEGSIILDGRDLPSLPPRERARWLAWLPQQVAAYEPLEAVDYLIGSRFAYDEPRATSRRIIRRSLDLCGVGHLARRPVTSISGGEFQRVQLAGLLAQDARFLLLDEPANHLDPALQRELYTLLAGEVRSGRRGVIAVTHEVNLIAALERAAARPVQVVGLREGRLQFDCLSSASEMDRRLTELYGLPHRRVELEGRRYFLPGLEPRSE